MSWASSLRFYLYLLCYYCLAFVVVKVLNSYAGGAVTAAHQQKKPENYSRVLPGEGFLIRCYGPMHIACRSCRHGNRWRSRKLHVSIAPVPRGPAQLHAALLLTQLGLLQVYTPQFHPAPHRLPTLQAAPPRKLHRMPSKNGPQECGCCGNLGDENCENENCDCICLHDIVDIAEQEGRASSATSSPPPPLHSCPRQLQPHPHPDSGT